MTTATALTWGCSSRDGLVHAFNGDRWCGDHIALCQHACPPQHILCTWTGRADVCPTCREQAAP